MSDNLDILTSLPEISVFYQKYWNKRPFLAKAIVPKGDMENLISPDELAGLSLEEDVRSRIVKCGETAHDWACEHGPFDEEVFSTLADDRWSLLVQDVEKYHSPTEGLLNYFNFSPRWLIDDIMVSYSVIGGGVGPHVDSYHVFLIQGMGERSWKIGKEPLDKEDYIQGLDLKILENDFEGDQVTVEQGDVLYIPPKFPHSGDTTSESMTFSIGFLGPSLAELIVEFGQYIEEQGVQNSRYGGDELDEKSSGHRMSSIEVENFRKTMSDALNSDQFEKWIRDYFENRAD